MNKLNKKELEQAVKEIKDNRCKMQQQLLDFASTDLLFFFSDKPELLLQQKKRWQPVLEWAEAFLNIKLNVTQSLNVPENDNLIKKLPDVFNSLSDKDFCCWYAASLNLRSVLLGLAMIKGLVDAKKAAELSAIEELWQNEQWGIDEQALAARQKKADELNEIESFLQCAM